MTPGDALHLTALALGPTLAVGSVVWLPRLGRWVRGEVRRRRAARAGLRPVGPPLEAVAADLRRLLRERQALRVSPDVAVRGARVRALDLAVTDCAVLAARALSVPVPERDGRGALPPPALERLLAALAAAGLVLPPGLTPGSPPQRR